MALTIIIDKGTRDILVANPPRNRAGEVILPVGADAEAVDVADAGAAKFAQVGCFRLRLDKTIEVLPPPAPTPEVVAEEDERDEARQAITALQEHVDRPLADWTNPLVIGAVKLLCRVCVILIRRAIGAASRPRR